MKNRDYWNWLEKQPDNIKKKIIEDSPWYNLPDGTHVWVNTLTTKRCRKEIDGHIYLQELGAKSTEYVWANTHYVNAQLYYEKATIKEYCDYVFSKTEFPKEIELFKATSENYHHELTIQLFEVEDNDGQSLPIPLCWEKRSKYRGRTVCIHPVWICDYKCLLFSWAQGAISYKWRPNDAFISLEPLTEKEIIEAF